MEAPKKSSGPRSYDHWDTYISRVLKNIIQDRGLQSNGVQISTDSIIVLNDIINSLMDKMHSAMHSVMDANKQRTLMERTVAAAVKITLPGELMKHARHEAESKLTAFENNAAGNAETPKSQTARATLLMPVSRVENMLVKLHFTRISPKATVYTAAVLEYILAEILSLAADAAMQSKQLRISPRHILLAIRRDEELSSLFKNDMFAMGGVVPNERL